MRLLNTGGILGYIIPDSWLNSDNFSNMRDALLFQWCLEKICTFGYKVFKHANIENTIMIVSQGKPANTVPIIHFESPQSHTDYNILEAQDIKRRGIIDPRYSKQAENIINCLQDFNPLKAVLDLNRGLHAYRTDGYGTSAFGNGPQTKRDKDERSYHADTKKMILTSLK